MRSKIQKISATIASVLLTFMLSAAAVFAIEVKPVRTELGIDPGASASVTIQVANPESYPIEVRSEIEIYTRNDERGFPIAEDAVSEHPLSIYDWINLPKDTITLAPNSEKEITFEISAPADAKPGGRYASIYYRPVDATLAKKVAVVPSLILVKVAGKEIRAGEILDFGIKEQKLLSDKNPQLAVSFQNNSNIHEKPSGMIQIFDSAGDLITPDGIPVNPGGGNVLPGSSRTFVMEWADNIQPGKFKAHLELEFNGNKKLEKKAEFEIDEKLKLKNFIINQFEDLTDFVIVLENKGNVFEKIRGRIEILDGDGEIVDSIKIPADCKYIAPSSTGSITVPWLSEGIPRGDFTAQLFAIHGFENSEIEDEIYFSSNAISHWLICGLFCGPLFILLAVFIFLKRKRQAN